ncbi:MAG TPA: hypothetical protein VES73_06785 [Lamprocystis sp. (in: g-proteobacteria)]|nr:hypothetical protein [Lamprocystis sp. (in: g-proteobacteria)]
MTARRTVGGRGQRPVGPLRAPTPQEVEWSIRMGQYRTRVPKGVFRYRSMAEANADWERWHVDLVAATVFGDGDD